MAGRVKVSVILLGILTLQTGCVFIESGREMVRQTARIFKMRPVDYRDMTEEDSDDWDWVGSEASPYRQRETDPDRWFKKYVQSEKARDIERNLGVD